MPMKVNKKVAEIKQYTQAEKILNDHITSYTKLIIGLSEKFELIPTKGLTKDLKNEYSILNGAKEVFFQRRWVTNLFSIPISL